MKKILCLCVAACLSFTLHAQEPTPEDVSADETPMSEASAAEVGQDAPIEDETAAAEGAAAEPSDDSASESAAAEEIPVEPIEEAPTPEPCESWRCRIADFFGFGADAPAAAADEAEEVEPTRLYAGLDFASVDVSFSSPALTAGFGRAKLDSDFLRARLGWSVFEQLAVELHLGAEGDDGRDAGSAAVAGYAGVFLVPGRTMLDIVDVSALLGYARLDVERPGFSSGRSGAAYGVNIELPLRRVVETLPDLRVGTGFVVYAADREARVYGAHLGLRYDFEF